jgi:hypothetical protein
MSGFETYQHFRGGMYIKLCEAMHTETEEDMVVYVCAVSGRTFCRPKAMFFETITEGDYTGPRFLRLPENTTKEERKKLKWF